MKKRKNKKIIGPITIAVCFAIFLFLLMNYDSIERACFDALNKKVYSFDKIDE